ncbi:hypothetical protein Tco_1096097 [Tanacetum coccineum]
MHLLIASYDIPLDLRPRLLDPNFRMINLPGGDTAIGIYSRIFDSSGVRIPFSSFLLAVLKYFKVHISQLVPLVFQTLSKQGDWFSFAKRGDPALVCLKVAKSGFNQNHANQPKAHIVKLCDVPEGVLVRSGLSRVWRNPMCDPVLRRFDNTAMSIYDFLYMPSLDKVTVREEPHRLDTSILGRVVDRTTSPAPVGTAIPRASPEEVVVTRPDRKAAGDEVEQTNNGTLDDDDQCDDSKFTMEGSENLNDVSQGEHVNVIPLRTFDPSIGLDVTYPPILLPDKEVEAHAELSGGARVGNIVGDVLERNLLPIVLRPYYIPYPYDESSRSEYPSYTREYWEEIHGVNLGLQKKELYKDPKVCRTALDRFPTPVETHRLRVLSSFELSDHMSCAQQTQTIKRQSADLKQQNESTVRANEEVSRLTAELGVLKSRCQTAEHKLNS